MKQLGQIMEPILVEAALKAPTLTDKKQCLMDLYFAEAISPSMLQWAIAVNGLKGE
jgi:hypothetical protein